MGYGMSVLQSELKALSYYIPAQSTGCFLILFFLLFVFCFSNVAGRRHLLLWEGD